MLRALRRESGFYRRLWTLAAPMILQNIITTSLGFADIFMVGLLGNAEMAAATAANVPVFLSSPMAVSTWLAFPRWQAEPAEI